MSNTLLTPTVIAREALLALENNLVLGNLVHRDFSNEFVKVGDTVRVRKPATFTAVEFDGDLTGELQAITEGYVDVKMDKVLDVSFELTSQELTLDLQNFQTQVMDPAMRALAQAVDERIAQLALDIPYFVSYDGTSDATKTQNVADIRAMLNTNKVPMVDRRAVLDPTTESKLITVASFLNAEKRGDTKALREGSMGRVMGMDWFMDQNIQAAPADSDDLAGAIDSGNGGYAAGTTTIHVDALGTTAIKKGTILTIADCAGQYVVTEDVTPGTNECDIKIYPGLAAQAVEDKVVTLKATHKMNLAFHKNAFALVTRPLAQPLGGAKAAVVNFRGLSCRVVYDYTILTKTNVVSIDILCGFKTLTQELACRYTYA